MSSAPGQVIPLTGEILRLTSEPCTVTCPSCSFTGLSVVDSERTICWHYCAPCCWSFFSCCGKLNCRCIDSWANPTDINHYCNKCGCFLGRYHKKKGAALNNAE